MAASNSVKVTMRKVKSTSGAVMFMADDDTLPITNIYFRKDKLEKFGMTTDTVQIEITVIPK